MNYFYEQIYSFQKNLFILLVTRSMTRLLKSAERENRPPLLRRIFFPFVRIDFCAAAERQIFLRQPARIISRRQTIAKTNTKSREESEATGTATATTTSTSTESTSAPARRTVRSKSLQIERRYIAPEQLRLAIEDMQSRIGCNQRSELKYNATFHSVKERSVKLSSSIPSKSSTDPSEAKSRK